MFSVAQLLDSAKEKGNIESDYRLAKVIGITQSAVSNYRAHKTMPDERVLEQLCALSGDDLAVIAAQVQAERARTSEGKNMWLMIARRLAGGASTAILSVLFCVVVLAGYPRPAWAANDTDRFAHCLTFLYIVSSTFFSVTEFSRTRSRWFTPFLYASLHG